MAPGSGNWLDIKVTKLAANEEIPNDIYRVSKYGYQVNWDVLGYSENEELQSPPMDVKLLNGQQIIFKLISSAGPHYVKIIDSSDKILHSYSGKGEYFIETKDKGMRVVLSSTSASLDSFLKAEAFAYYCHFDCL